MCNQRHFISPFNSLVCQGVGAIRSMSSLPTAKINVTVKLISISQREFLQGHPSLKLKVVHTRGNVNMAMIQSVMNHIKSNSTCHS
ncbi:hypothetical protein PILCRDRAFT_599736 [Piloderma croceum F 1598]|uniref:Uncharacterized protein n=1 Tax=Piloderma croceum (strain F 1598) TaxID=765440 RepID=A0A0C3FEB1_PILCF|nr:hypothetical protein PILCRDRAFT_599736 [Piloderma croceum F 1598]